jgi:hypothetical protein
MRALGENKFQGAKSSPAVGTDRVRISWKGAASAGESFTFHLAGQILPGKRSLKNRQRRSCLILVSVLSGLDTVRVEVDVQMVRQGLHIASIDIGLGGSAKAKRIQVQPKVRSGGERDQSS